MKILVTGGAGFIGSHLVEHLLSKGHDVTSLDDLSNGKEYFLQHILSHPKHTFIQGSAFDRTLVKKVMSDCDAVFHLAATLGVRNTVENPLKVMENNIDSTRTILEFAYQRSIKVVFASTSEIYGKNDNLPFNENSSRVLGPTSTHHWCYATAKALEEHLCLAYADKGLPVTIVRYFNAYGPRATATEYGGVVPKFITAALNNKPITVYGDGEQTRCFTYIEDTVKGTALCLNSKHNNEIFNIGIDQELSINDLAKEIKKLTGSQSQIVHIPLEKTYGKGFEETPNRVPDVSKAKNLLNFYPSITLEKGLRWTIEWFKKNNGESDCS